MLRAFQNHTTSQICHIYILRLPHGVDLVHLCQGVRALLEQVLHVARLQITRRISQHGLLQTQLHRRAVEHLRLEAVVGQSGGRTDGGAGGGGEGGYKFIPV